MSVTFFTDRDLSKQFPRVLSDAGIAVERHADHFSDSASDEEWLAEIGQRGWYALTHDQRIRYKPNERDAVMAAGVGLLILIGKAPYAQLATNFISSVARIEAFISNHSRPFIAEIYQPSPGARRKRIQRCRIELWLSHDDWTRKS